MLAFLVALPMKSAFAASVTVAVQQTGGAAQTVTCSLAQKGCTLPFILNAGQAAQQSVTINVVYTNGAVLLSFQTPNGYFYTRNMNGKIVFYNALWNGALQGSKTATYSIGLSQPLAAGATSPMLTSKSSQTPVATLLITATPSP